MAEFKVVLDGLDLDDDQYARVAQAVLTAGVKAVNAISREKAADFIAISAQRIDLEDWRIYGGWVLKDRYALQAREVLQEQGVLPRELGPRIERG